MSSAASIAYNDDTIIIYSLKKSVNNYKEDFALFLINLKSKKIPDEKRRGID